MKLLRKFTTYAMYLASREWVSSSPFLPAMLCMTPEITQERQLIKAALARLVQVPASLCLYTTTASLLFTQGVLQPMWRPVALLPQQAQPIASDESQRVALFTPGS